MIVRLQTSHTLPLFFVMKSQLTHWKHYKAQLINYVIMKMNSKVRNVNVCKLACKIKVLNGRVPVTWKWTITKCPFRFAFSHNLMYLNHCSWCGQLLRPKLYTYHDDVTTMENNRQVRRYVGTLVVVFCIARKFGQHRFNLPLNYHELFAN